MAFDSAGLFEGIQLVFHSSPQGERGLYWDRGARFPKSAYGSQATVAARLAKNYSLIIVLSHAVPSFAKPAIPKPQFPHIITNAESGMSIGRSFFDFFLSKRN